MSGVVNSNPKLKQLINGTITDITARDLAGVTKFYQYVLFRCHSLVSMEIPDTVTKIEKYALSDCMSMKNLTIGNSVREIEMWAFKYCIELEKVVIPDSVEIMGTYTFYDCRKLTDITISSGITSIGDFAFANIATNATTTPVVKMRATTPPTIQANTFDSNTQFIVPFGSLSLYQNATNWIAFANNITEGEV